MIIYSDDTSPWCAPVRAAVYAKGLDIPIEAPPGGTRSDEYRAISGSGTIPCLMLEDGTPLPESAVIVAYLDEKFPATPLRPADPEGRARVALLLRLAEGGVLTPLVRLFHDLSVGDPTAREKAVEGLTQGLGRVERFVSAEGYANGAFSQADCVLGPALFGVKAMGAAMLGAPALLADFPQLTAYDARVMQHPAVAKVVGELATALAAVQLPGG